MKRGARTQRRNARCATDAVAVGTALPLRLWVRLGIPAFALVVV